MNIYELRELLKNFELPKINYFSHDNVYLDLMLRILKEGNVKSDRTGTGTVSIFGPQLEFDLQKGFPLLTTKEVRWKKSFEEMLMFLNGETNTAFLHQYDNHLWDNWQLDDLGNLGPIYGKQWLRWKKYTEVSKFADKTICDVTEINQLDILIDRIKNNPNDRRMIVSGWNVSDLEEMSLPPCHTFFQVYINDNKLSLKLYQRSGDFGLGSAFNIAQYSFLTHLLAFITNKIPDKFIITYGDCHLYLNHLEHCYEQLQRIPFQSPTFKISNSTDWFPDYRNIKHDDVEVSNYQYHPFIKMPISV